MHEAQSKSNRNNIPKPRTKVRSKTVKHTKVLIRRLAADIGNQIGRTIGFVLCSNIYLSHSSTSSYHEKPCLNVSVFSKMDEIFKRMKQVSESGDIDAFYILIQEAVNLLDHIDKIPFVDTPLHIAASTGHIQFSLEMMGLKPSFARKPNLDGFSPIHLALQNGHIELVRRLIQADGDLVRVKGRERLTPLHYVVAKGDHLDLLDEFLLICPDSLTDVTIQNETALHIALKYNKLETFKLLVGWLGSNWSKKASFYERAILNWKDDEGNTVLHIAVSKNETQASTLVIPKCLNGSVYYTHPLTHTTFVQNS